MPVRCQGKAAMTVYPADGFRVAPGSVSINAAKPLGDNAFFLLLFVPDRPIGLVHHFIGTDNAIIAQGQEIAEK